MPSFAARRRKGTQGGRRQLGEKLDGENPLDVPEAMQGPFLASWVPTSPASHLAVPCWNSFHVIRDGDTVPTYHSSASLPTGR